MPPRRALLVGFAAALVGGLLAAACSEAEAPPAWGDGGPATDRPSAPDPIGVAVAPVIREPMQSLYSTSATLRADKRATVTSRTRGVLEQLFVEEGDRVVAGQAIAQLEDGEQRLAVDRYEMAYAAKQRELDRTEGLNEQDLISDSEFELIRREAEESSHDLDLARLELERTTISAPFDGIVVLRHLDLGATVNDGSPIFDLADIDPLYVDVNVPERHVARLSPGQMVQVSADAVDAAVAARIERLAPVVDSATGTVKVTVAVDRSVALRPGAFVEIDVITDVHEDALVVPRSALVAEGRRWLVFRTNETGNAVEAIEVELGFEDDRRVEIAGVRGDRSLQPGDTVVVLGASALSDGSRIKIADRAEQAEPDEEPSDGEDVVGLAGAPRGSHP